MRRPARFGAILRGGTYVLLTGSVEPFAHELRVAYFSMEIALRAELPTYSGGLGVLAGDTMRAAADLGLPMVAVTLLSRAGYFHQEIASGRQIETPDWWQPEKWGETAAGEDRCEH